MGAAELWIEEDAGNYDPGIGRFLQRDPEPGKLNLPMTVVNSYVYVANNPANLTDPSGKFFWFVIGAFALIGAISNLNDALKVPGASFWQILGSTLTGAALGAINGLAIEATGPLGGILVSGITSGLNNAANQGIFTGNIDTDKVFAAGFTGLATATLGLGVGSVFSKQLTALGMSVVGSSVGTGLGTFAFTIDSGVPTADECSQINTLCYQYQHQH